LTLNYPDDSDLQLYVNVDANRINLDYFGLNNKLNEILYTLYSADFDNSGKKFLMETNNLNYLRGQKGIKNFIFKVNDVVLKKELFSNVNVNLDVSRYAVKLDHLNVEHQLARYNGKVQLDLSNIKPKLDVDLKFSQLSGEVIDAIKRYQKGLAKKYDAELLQKEKKGKVLQSDINFYSVNNFDGDIKLNIDKFYSKDLHLSNVQIMGKLLDGIITLDKINADGFNGNIKINGNIFTLRPVFGMQLGIGLSNVNPSLLGQFLLNYKNNSGYMSISGTLETRGVDTDAWLKNLYGKFRVQGKDIIYDGFGLSELVELPQLSTNYEYKMKRLSYYAKYGDTKFDTVDGNITILNGVAKMLNVKLENKLVSGLLNLIYSIPNRYVSANSKFSFEPKKGAGSIVISTTASGNLNNAKSKVDTSLLQQYLMKQTAINTRVVNNK
jgi:hypothetical protein